jgi:Glycine zipper 2TM domain
MKMNKTLTSLVLAATAITGFSAAPAAARHHDNGYYDRDGYYHRDEYRDYRDDRDSRYDRDYRDDRGYDYDRRQTRNRCSNGTGGLIIGGAAGGLLGNQIARRGDRTVGTIIGAAVGALGGRALDKASSNCRR